MQNNKKFGGLRVGGILKESTLDNPLVTIITVVFNGEKYLEKTIQSIISQKYKNFEYIIIDGGSTDGTLDILKKYDSSIDYWISEPDKGISDAFNKGIALAKGTYINFQGDGDGFLNEEVLSKVMEGINPEIDMFICGKINRISLSGDIIYTSKQPKNFNKVSLLFRMSLPHQGLFTHKMMFQKYGLFDIDNKFCMDYEILLRAYKNFPEVILKDLVVANWRADGAGTGRIREILDAYNFIKQKNKVAHPILLWTLHYWTLFKYNISLLIPGSYK